MTASVSISSRRPKRCSGGSVSWRILPHQRDRGSLIWIITSVAMSGVSVIGASSVYQPGRSWNCSRIEYGSAAGGVVERPGDRFGVVVPGLPEPAAGVQVLDQLGAPALDPQPLGLQLV